MIQQQSGANTPFPTGQLSIGGVLSRTFSVLKQNSAVFIGLAILATTPSILAEFLLPASNIMGRGWAQVISGIFGLMVKGAIAYATFHVFKGNRVYFSESINRGMSRIVLLFLTSLLMSIGVGLASILFLIPGLILLCCWAVAIQVCAVEQLGPIKSIRRSADLTKGYRWQIFALLLIVNVGTILATFGLVYLLFEITKSDPASTILTTLIIAIPEAFSYVMYAIVYYDLRSIKEGITLGGLVSVFE